MENNQNSYGRNENLENHFEEKLLVASDLKIHLLFDIIITFIRIHWTELKSPIYKNMYEDVYLGIEYHRKKTLIHLKVYD